MEPLYARRVGKFSCGATVDGKNVQCIADVLSLVNTCYRTFSAVQCIITFQESLYSLSFFYTIEVLIIDSVYFGEFGSSRNDLIRKNAP